MGVVGWDSSLRALMSRVEGLEMELAFGSKEQ